MSKRGFTIVEVIVSLALLLGLAALGNLSVNAASAQRDRARQTTQNAQNARQELYAGAAGTAAGNATYNFGNRTTFSVTAPVETVTVSGADGSSITYILFAPPEDEP